MRLFRRAAAVAVVSCVAACAPQRAATPNAGQDFGRAADLTYGTIVSIRPASIPAGDAGVSNILLAIGGSGSPPAGAGGRGRAVECIVHEDFAPGPISVVQSDGDNFRPGERVTIARGVRTRLSHGAPPPPAGS